MIPTIQNNPIQGSLANLIEQSKKKHSVDIGDVHSLMLIVAWVGLASVALLAIKFKHSKYAKYVHGIFMLSVGILTWMSGFLAFIEYGIESKIGAFHTYLGISIFIILLVQTAFGISTVIAQKNSFVHPNTNYVLNEIHKVLGIMIYIFSQIQIGFITFEKKPIFLPTVIISSLTLIAFILLSTLKKKMSVFVLNRLNFSYRPKKISLNQNQEQLQSFENSQQIKQYERIEIKGYFRDYFIFADRIYDIHRVLSHHPGGYEVIKKIRGKEVDRYIYDVELINFEYKQKRASFSHFHSFNSMKLAGEPLGRIKSVPTYKYMYEKNMVRMVKNAELNHAHHIRVVYLQKIVTIYTFDSFYYQGYSERSQFGKYYALSIYNKITRLYSVVNFLRPQNLKWMEGQIKKDFPLFRGIFTTSNREDQEQVDYNQEGVVPLLIKKGDSSSMLTRQFLRKKYYLFKKKIRLSMAYGQGLSLNQVQLSGKKNKIIIYAGGTGLNPFLDLIDIAFKQKKVEQEGKKLKQIVDKICLKQRKIIHDFSFEINIIVRQIVQINYVSLYQMNYLAKDSNVMKVSIYCSETSKIQYNYLNDEYYQRLDNIQKSNEASNFFPTSLKEFAQISHIYICGPLKLCDKVEKILKSNKVPLYKLTVL